MTPSSAALTRAALILLLAAAASAALFSPAASLSLDTSKLDFGSTLPRDDWRADPPPPPSPAVQKLEKQYADMLNSTCGNVAMHAPVLPADQLTKFMQAYSSYNCSGDESEVMALARALLSLDAVKSFLTLPDSFVPGGLDANMVKCAVLIDATPLGLATFAAQNASSLQLVSDLLGNTMLMRDMLVAGGPVDAKYGEAMAIYTALREKSSVLSTLLLHSASDAPWDDRNQSTILARVALGTALGHAVPIAHRYNDAQHPNDTYVDPVERYLHYEKAYLAGELDPAHEVLTVFECRWTTNCDASNEDLQWLRDTLANYRPDEIAMDYSWRYSRAVRTEVSYGDPKCDALPGVCNGHYAQIPAAGGECGPRAFFGRFARKAFGMPTFGVTQPGHAAMSAWSPNDGWHILLGASWDYSWWNSRGGNDFYLEATCREQRPQYQQVLRGGWLARALGDEPVDPSWGPRNPSHCGKGGNWSALMLYAKKIFVNETSPIPPRHVGPSLVPTKVQALVDAWPQKWPTPNITIDAQGNIHIPAAAYFYTNHSANIDVMKSYDLKGEQLLHNGGEYVDPTSSSFAYELNMAQAATRYLTANITTWHMNTDLSVSYNSSSSPISLPVFYTVGHWNETQPIELRLVQGRNVLYFYRSTTNELVIKDFNLYVNKPNIPAPPGNYTPSPPPKPNDYIEVSALTTCVKQGITDVPEKYCNLACESLGLKFTGDKPRQNMTGCYALTGGEWNGGCNYNTNKSATICSDPPCTVSGSVAQQICLRQ